MLRELGHLFIEAATKQMQEQPAAPVRPLCLRIVDHMLILVWFCTGLHSPASSVLTGSVFEYNSQESSIMICVVRLIIAVMID